MQFSAYLSLFSFLVVNSEKRLGKAKRLQGVKINKTFQKSMGL
jgi:hypothetical protein